MSVADSKSKFWKVPWVCPSLKAARNRTRNTRSRVKPKIIRPPQMLYFSSLNKRISHRLERCHANLAARIVSLGYGRIFILYAVEPRGIAAKKSRARRRRQRARVVIDQPEHFFITAREQAHRPVGAVHQSVLSKRFEDDVEVRPEIGSLPFHWIRFGNQSGNLAAKMWCSGQFTELLAPRREDGVFDERLGDMVEHKRLVRESVHQFDRGRQLFRINQDVIGQLEVLQFANAAQ